MSETKQNSLLSRIFRAVFFGVGGAVGSRVFMVLAGILLSNILGQEPYGRFSSVNDTVNLFVTFSGVGVSATLTRYIAANRSNADLQGIFIRTLSGACMVMSVLFSAALALFAPQISQLCAGTRELSDYFRWVAVAVFFASMSSVEQSVMLGFERFAASSLVQLIRCFLYCVLCFVGSKLYGIYGAIAALVLSHGAQYFLSLAYNHLYFQKNRIRLRWQWDKATWHALVSFAFPAFVSGLFVLPVNWIGNAILTQTAGFAQMAVFSVARQWMSYITYIPSQLGQMRPIYTDLYAKGDYPQLKKLLLRSMVITTGAAIAVGGGVLLLSRFILGAYGEGYIQGTYTLAFMVLAAVLYTAQVQTGFLLQAAGKMWAGLFINGLWGVILLGCFACLTDLADLGYAISYSVAYVITLLLQLAVVSWVLRRMKAQINNKENNS